MRPKPDQARAMPKAWPALVAIATVVAIAIGTLVVDVFVERGAGEHAAELVDNATRSITLVDDLRRQAHQLTEPQREDRLAAILATIERDSEAYEPLTTYPGERDEWRHLQALLARVAQHHPILPSTQLFAEIEDSVTRLVAINQDAAEHLGADIRSVNRTGVVVDLALGGLTLVAAFSIAVTLRRSYRNQRELLAIHLHSLDDRATELEAFAGRVAHDLRGPLTPIVLAAEVLARHDRADVQAHGNRIGRNAGKMAAMIDDLLSLSVSGRPSPGKAEIKPVMMELLDELEPELRDATVDVSLADCTAACPAQVLAQLLRNVIANASKYRSPERKLVLHVAASRDVDRGRVTIAIADNGIGMDAEACRHAFDPFYRCRTTAALPGHGLGLAIVKRMVDALGGSCLLESAAGAGTCVRLELPTA